MWVDPGQLHVRGAAFAEIGAEVQQVLERLDQAISREGRWWGDDEAGAEFEKSYAPDAKQAIATMRKLAEALRGFGGQVVTTADTVSAADQLGGGKIGDTGVGATDPGRPEQMPNPGQVPLGAGAAASDPSSPPSSRLRGSGAPVVREVSPAGQDSGYPPVPGKSGEPPPRAAHELPPSARGGDGGVADGGGPVASSPSTVAPHKPEHPVRTDDSRPLRPAAPPPKWAGTGQRREPVQATGPSMGGARKPPGTPWSADGTISDRSAPAAGAPSSGRRVFPPAGKPAPGRTPPEKAKQAVERSKHARSAAAEVENALARAARMVGDRHGMAVSGFDGPGLDAVVVGDFLAAVDDVLSRYPIIDIRRLAVGDIDTTAVVRVVRHRDSHPNAPGTSWSVTLDRETASDPERLETVLRDLHRPDAERTQAAGVRPVYAETVREFGRAFDLAGGGLARRRAQRSLIGEYLSGGAGYRTADLGRVVAGYRRWRDQLSGAAFDRGRFHPEKALVEAFADVIINGDNASEPARTLSGVLTDTAAERSRPR